ncbi:MAG TPA: hypothetical protein VGC20_10785 [bacterium]
MSPHQRMQGARRRLRAVLPGIVALLCLLLALAALARGAEFVSPPGLNVEGQEAVLKEQVTRMARDLVGDALRDVVVSVRYVRTDGTGGRRIKLPGVNHFIAPSGAGTSDIVAGHVRVRQILVTVADSVSPSAEALTQELRQQGHFDPGEGDLVRVVKVAANGSGKTPPMAAAGAENGKPGDLADDAKELAKRLKQEQSKQQDERASAELGKMIAQATLAEAQATTYLIKARQAYFNGDYDRALDQILQSIAQNPNNPQAYAMLGSLYYAVDWKQLAVKYWEKSLTLDPENREIQELVAKVRSNPNF